MKALGKAKNIYIDPTKNAYNKKGMDNLDKHKIFLKQCEDALYTLLNAHTNKRKDYPCMDCRLVYNKEMDEEDNPDN